MRVRYYSVVVAGVCSILLFTGCAKVPQQQVDQAKSALESARAAEADKYVAPEFNAAQDSLNAALTEIEKQKSVSPLSRKYDRVKFTLLAVVTIAQSAKEKSGEEKAKVAVLVDSTLSLVKASSAQANELLIKAHKSNTVIDSLRMQLAIVDTTILQAEMMKNNGDLVDVLDNLNACSVKLDSLKISLTTAIEKSAKPALKPVKKPAMKTESKKAGKK